MTPPADLKNEPWLRAVLASTLDPVITIDLYGRIKLASDSVERVFGWKPAELIGRNVDLLMPEPHRSQHDEYLSRYRESGTTTILGKSREFEAVRKDGSRFPCEVSVSRAELPEPIGPVFTAIIRDISDRKRAEAELRRLNDELEHKNKELESFAFNAEKLASIGKLAASIAHEIRNPLTSIKVRLYSIRRAVSRDTRLTERFRVVWEEIDRLESVVRNFLDFSRPPALKLQPNSVSRLVDKTLELVGQRLRELGIETVRREDPNLPIVHVDAEQMKQVLLNLLTNAAEAMPNGGRIEITAGRGASENGSMVVVRVKDTGPGIPNDLVHHVFEPFFSTKEDGTGLGLCVSARIVERHGGRLELEETGRNGTCFAVWIPASWTTVNE
jgi:PAS domain S-box-containing protein